jgi:glycosyltransferase involved in cell wall biosynthesis
MISVISVGRNCGENIERFNKSLMAQTYADWVCITAPDKSDDDTVKNCFWLHVNNIEHYGFRAPENETQFYMRNFYRALSMAKSDIIVTVDLDDYLASPTALETIAKAYEDKDVWLTYGSYLSSDGCHNHWNKPLTDDDWQNIRKAPWKTSHLRTFRKSLFYKIRPESFLDMDGNWFKRCTDRAMMLPMLEMAGPEHTRFIDEPLYYLNARDKSERQDEIEYEKRAIEHIRQQAPYERLTCAIQ